MAAAAAAADADNAGASSRIGAAYQKMTQREHILARSDTYTGSLQDNGGELTWVLGQWPPAAAAEAPAEPRMVLRKSTYVPGLLKLFDEILVNAADNKQKDGFNATTSETLKLTYIRVRVDEAEGAISVENDGHPVPVVLHPEHKMYVPQLIFGELLTSSNYNDSEDRFAGGRNGLGAKLANVYSTRFEVEINDAKTRKLHWRQVFTDNMAKTHPPEITESKDRTSWTRITFVPDWARFTVGGRPMRGLDSDLAAMILRRTYDVAATVPGGVKVYFNDIRIPASGFSAYTRLFLPAPAPGAAEAEPVMIEHKTKDGMWHVVVSASTDGRFHQHSFVNNIHTKDGGTHVDYIRRQVVDGVLGALQQRHKAIKFTETQIRNCLWVFVNCLVNKPRFDTQTKVRLTSRPEEFGTKCELPDAFIKKVIRSSIVESVLEAAEKKAESVLRRTDGKKVPGRGKGGRSRTPAYPYRSRPPTPPSSSSPPSSAGRSDPRAQAGGRERRGRPLLLRVHPHPHRG